MLAEFIASAREFLAPSEVEVVIYHSPCNDGFTAALVAHKFLSSLPVTYIPAAYQEDILQEKLINKNILLLDFSFKKSDFIKIREISNKIMILDHHKTPFEDLVDSHGKLLDGVFLETAYSGARLAWEYFNEDLLPRPKLIDYVEDRDLWKFNYPESKPLSSYMFDLVSNSENKFNFDFRKFRHLLLDQELDQAIAIGQKLLATEQLEIAKLAQAARLYTYEIDNHKYSVIALQLEAAKHISELAAYLYTKYTCDFVWLWYKSEDNIYKSSLRASSDNTIDVSSISKQYGGGGHPKAAGMITSINPSELLSEKKKLACRMTIV